jgi:hypothetical protein
LKIWLGAMTLNDDNEPFDEAMEVYWEEAYRFAEQYCSSKMK